MNSNDSQISERFKNVQIEVIINYLQSERIFSIQNCFTFFDTKFFIWKHFRHLLSYFLRYLPKILQEDLLFP